MSPVALPMSHGQRFVQFSPQIDGSAHLSVAIGAALRSHVGVTGLRGWFEILARDLTLSQDQRPKQQQ
jgi:hypothetical protein